MSGKHPIVASSIVIAGIIAAACYRGVFYQTGAQFYDACWKKSHARGREADSPELAASWASCESTADNALFGAGWIFAGNPANAATPQLKAVGATCPNGYNLIPNSGPWAIAVEYIQDDGGPTFADRFSPAREAVLRVFKSRWPNCVATAASNGFPHLVKRGSNWEYETPCIPCQAEEGEIARKQKESEEWKRRLDGMSEAERTKAVDAAMDAAIEAAFKDEKKASTK